MNHEVEQNHRIRNTAIAIGLAATALLHGYIEKETTHGHGPRVEAPNPFAASTTHIEDAGTERAGEPYVDTVVETEVTPGDPIGTKTAKVSFTGAAYARAFEEDPRAGELETEPLSELVSTVESLQRNGWDVALKIQGLASAEDESNDTLDGLQTPSAANQRLADYRSGAFIDEIVSRGIDESIISQEPGLEDELTDTQVQTLESMSQQYGYDSVYDMVEAFNLTPQEVPIAVAMTLTEWLGKERGVSVVIVATRNEVGPGTSTPTEKEVCFVPVIAIQNKITETEPWKVTIPYALFGAAAGLIVATGATMGVVLKEDIARTKSRRLSAQNSSGGGGGGTGGDGDGAKEPTPTETEPTESIDQAKPEKKKRSKLPWLITPIFIVASGLAIRECVDDTPAKAPDEVVQEDVCRDKEHIEKVVGTRTVVIKNGRAVRTTTEMLDD